MAMFAVEPPPPWDHFAFACAIIGLAVIMAVGLFLIILMFIRLDVARPRCRDCNVPLRPVTVRYVDAFDVPVWATHYCPWHVKTVYYRVRGAGGKPAVVEEI